MRFSAVLIGLVVVLAFAGTAAAAPGKTTSIDVTLSGAGCGTAGTDCGTGGGGSCLCFAAFWNFAGRANVSPPLGWFTFAALYQEGHEPAEPVDDPATYSGPFDYRRSLEIVLTAANGERLVLESSSSSTAAPSSTFADGGTVDGTWAVDQARSTGRFARFTGSGSYGLAGTIRGTYEAFSVRLVGTLTFS